MKRYAVFTWYGLRPVGGMNDFLDCFETIPEALDNILDERNRYYQIVDIQTMQVVKEGIAWFKNFSPGHFRKD